MLCSSQAVALCIYNEMLKISNLHRERVYLSSWFGVTVMCSVGLIALDLW